MCLSFLFDFLLTISNFYKQISAKGKFSRYAVIVIKNIFHTPVNKQNFNTITLCFGKQCLVFSGNPCIKRSFNWNSDIYPWIVKQTWSRLNSDFFILQYEIIYIKGETNLRLSGGSHNMEGRVEILRKGQWAAICDEDWDDVEATIVCKTLASFPFDRYTWLIVIQWFYDMQWLPSATIIIVSISETNLLYFSIKDSTLKVKGVRPQNHNPYLFHFF